MAKQSLFTRCVASLLMLTMPLTTTTVLAQQTDMSAVGRQGQVLANELIQQFHSSGKPSLDNNSLTMPGTSSPLSISDLFPSTSSSNQDPDSYYFPDSYSTNTSEYKGVFNSSQAMDDKGTNAQAHLYDDATSGDPSVQGAAYKIILDMTNRSRPDLREDPMFNQTRDVIGNIDDLKKEFADCSTESVFSKDSRPAHVPDYERCERVVDKSAQCEIIHNYDAAVVKHHGGPFNLDSCGDGCTQMWIGKVGNNYWSGYCSIYEQSTSVTVVNPDAITSATLEYAKWDDYMQVWVGAIGKETLVWAGPNGNFPPETEGQCELSTSWSRNLNVDVTQYFKNVEPGQPVNFKIRVSVAGEGEGYGRIRLKYDPSKAITKDEWIPENCVDAALAVQDGFAKGTFECIDNPATPPECTTNDDGSVTCDRYPEGWVPGTPYDGCVYLNGVKVCEESLAPSPLDGIPSMCKKVAVDSDYDFYKGAMDCYIDANGVKQCPVNDGGNLNSCGEFENNPQCGFISSTCVKGAEGGSGECYVFEDTYDCGYDVDLGTIKKDVKIECAGPIRCMGTDCLDVSFTQNNDFAKASALLNAAQFMAQDMACSGYDDEGNPTGEENVICQVFPGDANECKKAVGGVVNCCEKPDGISFADYVTLLMATPKLDTGLMYLAEQGYSVGSSYAVLREGVVENFSEISKPFASAFDGISSGVDTVKQTVKEIMDQIQDKVADLFADAFAEQAIDEAGQKIAEGTAKATAQEFMKGAGQVISFIGTVYTIYSVTMLAIKMIFKCTEDELSLNVQRELKSCSYVGSYCKTEVLGVCIEKREAYCCFSSPLSRIIQEQVRPQLGMSFGEPENPVCGGLSMDQIGDIDWEKVNLDEWMAILQSTGNWPNAEDINIESLTGAGSTFDLGSRVDAEERARERLKDSAVDDTRLDISETYSPATGGPTIP